MVLLIGAMPPRPEVWVPVLSVVSILYLLLVVFFVWLVRSLELKLLLLGLLTALLAAWLGTLSEEEAVSVQMQPGPTAAVGQVFSGGGAAGLLGRVAVLLVLGGIAVSVLNRWSPAAVPPGREKGGLGDSARGTAFTQPSGAVPPGREEVGRADPR